MARGRRIRAGHRGGDAGDWHAARGSDDERRNPKEPEDDPFRDLRPADEDPPDPPDPDGDEFVWPEMHDENEDDV
jgi:hypothetical protein